MTLRMIDLGVVVIGRKCKPINVIVHYPKTEEGKLELAKRVACIRADYILNYIRKLDCPSWQKEKLVDAIIDTVRNDKADAQSK